MTEITVQIKTTKTGKPTEKEMDKARKLTAKLIDSIGKKAIAKQFGVSVNTIYRWKLIPARYVLIFCSTLTIVSVADLRPDMVCCKES